MPLYEYQCSNCQHTIELIQKIDDPAPTTCTSCSTGAYEKMLSNTSFHLQGHGWYKDGYSNAASAPTATDSKDKSSTD